MAATELGRYFVSISADTSGVGASLIKSLKGVERQTSAIGNRIGGGLGKGIDSKLSSAMSSASKNASNVLSKTFSKTTSGLKKAGSAAISGISTLVSSTGKIFASLGKTAISAVESAASKTFGVVKSAAKAAAVAATAAIGATLSLGFKRLSNIEQAETVLKSLGINVSKAMDQANAAVKGTKFGLDEAAQSIADLSAAGVSLDDTPKYLSAIADAATISGGSMKDVGKVVSQVAAAGKANIGDMWQLTDQGINIFGALEKQTGTTREELLKMFSQGKITSDMFIKALGDTYEGVAALGGTTVKGAFANLQAAIGRVGAEVLKNTFDALPDVIARATGLVDKFAPALTRLGQVFMSGVTPALEAVLDGVDRFGTSGIDKVADAATTGMGYLKSALEAIKPILSEVFSVLKTIFSDIFSLVKQLGSSLGRLAQAFAPVVSILALPVWNFAKGVLQQIVNGVENMSVAAANSDFTSWATSVASSIKTMSTYINPLVAALVKFVGVIAQNVWTMFGDILRGISPVLKDIATTLTQTLGSPVVVQTIQNITTGFANLLALFGDAAWQVVKALLGTITSLLGTLSETLVAISQNEAFQVAISRISAALTSMMEPLRVIGEAFISVFSDVVTTAADILATVLEALRPVLDGVASAAQSLSESTLPSVLGVLADVVDRLAPTFGDLLKHLIPVVAKIADGAWTIWGGILKVVAAVLEPIVKLLSKFFEWLDKNEGAANALGAALVGAFIGSKIGSAIDTVSTALKSGKAMQSAFNAVANMNPYVWIAALILGAVAALVYFFTQTETGKKAWKSFTNFLKRAGKKAGEVISGAFDDIKRAWEAMGSGIKWVYTNLIKKPLKWMKARIDDLIEALGDLKEAGEKAWDWVGDKLTGWIPGLADGGIVPGPVTARTARADNVLTRLSPGEIVWSNADIQRAGGRGKVEEMRRGNATGNGSGAGAGIHIEKLSTMNIAELIRELEKLRRREARMAVA